MEWFWQSCSGTRKLIGQSQGATAMLRPFESSSNYKSCNALCGRKGESAMPCTEAYREHIMYTFSGYCKTVIRFAALLRYAVRQLSSPMGSLPPHCLSSVLMNRKYKKSLSFWRKRVYNKATANRN